MSSAFDAFYNLGSSNAAKGKGRRRRRRNNELEENEDLETPAAHKKKVHVLGNSQTITIDNVRIDFPLKPCTYKLKSLYYSQSIFTTTL
jgi:hypothetical protein